MFNVADLLFSKSGTFLKSGSLFLHTLEPLQKTCVHQEKGSVQLFSLLFSKTTRMPGQFLLDLFLANAPILYSLKKKPENLGFSYALKGV